MGGGCILLSREGKLSEEMGTQDFCLPVPKASQLDVAIRIDTKENLQGLCSVIVGWGEGCL